MRSGARICCNASDKLSSRTLMCLSPDNWFCSARRNEQSCRFWYLNCCRLGTTAESEHCTTTKQDDANTNNWSSSECECSSLNFWVESNNLCRRSSGKECSRTSMSNGSYRNCITTDACTFTFRVSEDVKSELQFWSTRQSW